MVKIGPQQMRGGPGACPGLSGPAGAGPGPHLALGPAVLSDCSDPAQHVIPILSLKEIFTEVSGGQPEHVPPLGLAVGDVHQAGADADGRRLVLTCDGRRRPCRRRPGLPPLLAQREGARPQRGVHPLPLAQAAARFLQGDTRRGERLEGEGMRGQACPPCPQSPEGPRSCRQWTVVETPHPMGHEETPCSTSSGTWGSLLPTVCQLSLPGHCTHRSQYSPKGPQSSL